ncbi:MAG: 30S ribosomal protein S19 [Candidatus Brocadiia bacterium]|nr:30S ribosomal protein S19 [Planctomycetota bacterium]
MSRSLKKGPYVDDNVLKKVMKQKEEMSHEPIRTWARSCTIIPDFVGHTFLVHNGRDFKKVSVTEDMVGHKLGEFSLTRRFRGHGTRVREEEEETGETEGPTFG